MDTLGKIFVFAVMVMSVVFMSFAIAIFSSHTNWQKESERLQTELEQATAERAAKESELTTLIDQNAASEKDQEQVVKKLETALQQKDAELAGLKKKREAELSDLDKDIAELSEAKDERDAADALVGKLREEIHGLQDKLKKSVNDGASLAAAAGGSAVPFARPQQLFDDDARAPPHGGAAGARQRPPQPASSSTVAAAPRRQCWGGSLRAQRAPWPRPARTRCAPLHGVWPWHDGRRTNARGQDARWFCGRLHGR